ncbi:FecR family protein [Novosphingobium album (ex Liu et al. 2023)]|uniref:FecR domain-containing protein n=1 Tax=Novosphingobium album (ex Liu et al. 2023) TaxID=3031130 RepID=A0ABT5WR22_9SPHN|nr:FecR domain-containing protein [Novosphingobium album (ex Liu et al. 2023)]MDE8652471.1 FecR domain-containing protein [Novosphingobium album (ex Liu et al. 2023)]
MRRQEAIEDQALDWLIRRNAPDWTEDEQAELDAWLDESMAHKAAFWRADHLWQQADRIRSLGIEHDDRADEHGPRRRWWPAAIAASLVAAVGIGGLSVAPRFLDQPAPQVQQARFDTPIGGRRVVPLVDGSKVELNTQTVLRTAVGQSKREVWLDSGEAFFEVAHRDGEPFVVHAGRQTITVLGTKFSVRRDKDRVTVNVLEGRVRVDDGEGAMAHAAIITAGDTAISRGPSTLIAAKSEERVADALAWRDGMLSFDQAPLTEVVAEFNRYNRTRLVVTDAAAGRIPIGGSFQASSVDSFTRLLRDAYGLKIERDDTTVKISAP